MTTNQEQQTKNQIKSALDSAPFCCDCCCCGLRTGLILLFVCCILNTVIDILMNIPPNIFLLLLNIFQLFSYGFGMFAVIQGKRSFFGLIQCVLIVDILQNCILLLLSVVVTVGVILGSTAGGLVSPELGQEAEYAMIVGVTAAALLVIVIIVKCAIIQQIRKASHIIDQVKMQSAVGV